MGCSSAKPAPTREKIWLVSYPDRATVAPAKAILRSRVCVKGASLERVIGYIVTRTTNLKKEERKEAPLGGKTTCVLGPLRQEPTGLVFVTVWRVIPRFCPDSGIQLHTKGLDIENY